MGQNQAHIKYLPGSNNKTKISNVELMPTGDNFPFTKRIAFSHDYSKILLDYGLNKSFFESETKQTIQLWDTQERKCLSKYKIEKKFLYEMALFPDGSKFTAIDNNSNIGIYDSMNGKILKKMEQQELMNVSALKVTSDGNYIFSGHSDGIIRQWDIQTGTCIKKFNVNKSVYFLRLSSNNKLLVSQDSSYKVKVWKVDTGECGISLDFNDNIQAQRIKLYDNYIIIGCSDGKIKIFDSENLNQLFILNGHWNKIKYVQMISKQGNLVSQDEKGFIKIWRLKDQKCLANRKIKEERQLLMESQEFQNVFFQLEQGSNKIWLWKAQSVKPVIEISIPQWSLITSFRQLKNQLIAVNGKEIGFGVIENQRDMMINQKICFSSQ